MNHIKIIISIFFFSFLTFSSPLFSAKKGDINIHAGLGVFDNWHIDSDESLVPPVFFRTEFIVRDDIGPGLIGIGGHLSYDSYKKTVGSIANTRYGWKQARTILGLNLFYHYYPFEKLDVYGKLLTGIKFVDAKQNGEWPEEVAFESEKSGIAVGLGCGVHYSLTNKIGAFSEIGYDIGYFIFGVSFKIK